MNLCKQCGVELEKEVIKCPLCGKIIGEECDTEGPGLTDNSPSDILLIHKTERRRHLWELSGIIAFSGIAVCTIVDFELGNELTWSLFADTSIIATWICLTLILMAFKKYFIVIPGLLLTILSMLFLFDSFNGSVSWFYAIGLPVTISLFASLSIITLLWKSAHFKGFNLLAIAFFVLSVFCIIIEIFIDKYIFNTVSIRWSAIAGVSLLPIALILLFIHYRMKKGKRLDSYFHV